MCEKFSSNTKSIAFITSLMMVVGNLMEKAIKPQLGERRHYVYAVKSNYKIEL
jgi:hypothetical protein